MHLIHDLILIFSGGPSYLLDPIALKLGASEYNEDFQDYIVACDDKTLGNMEFTFGKFKVVMTPGDYLDVNAVSKIIIQQIMCRLKLLITFIYSFFQGKCVLNMRRADNLNILLLGDPFLRKVTLILDQENDRAGLAKSNIDKPVQPPTA